MKKILITLMLLFCTGLSFGLYQYFRPPVSLKNLKAEVVLSAAQLKEQVTTDPLAKNKLSNKVILVEGMVSSVEKGDQVSIIIDSSIRGELDKNTQVPQVGQKVQIKGMLGGYDEIFEEVVLVKSQLQK